MKRYRDLSPAWRAYLKDWVGEFGENVPVAVYEDDGLDGPDVWDPKPHLAVREDLDYLGKDRSLVWPVGYDGWADIRAIGWEGVARLLREGNRT